MSIISNSFPKIKTVTLCLTECCNLNCVYCYEHNKSNRHMDVDTAKRIIHDELYSEDSSEEITFEMFGGEPFLEFPTMKELLAYLTQNKWGKKYSIFTTTNGTLLTDEIKSWLIQNSSTIICSLS